MSEEKIIIKKPRLCSRLDKQSIIECTSELQVNVLKLKLAQHITSYNIQKLSSAYIVFLCFTWFSEQMTIIPLYNINLSVFVTEAESVYCAVWTGPLNQIDSVSSLKG